MHKVDALGREARRDRGVLLLHVEDQRQETFDLGRVDVVPVGALNEGLVGSRGGGGVSSEGWLLRVEEGNTPCP